MKHVMKHVNHHHGHYASSPASCVVSQRSRCAIPGPRGILGGWCGAGRAEAVATAAASAATTTGRTSSLCVVDAVGVRQQRLRRGSGGGFRRRASVRRGAAESSSSDASTAEIGAACNVNALKDGDFSGCSLKDLEMMYVDAVWSFYKEDADRMLDNDTYDQLKLELNFQGSGMPDLSRREVEFVEASIMFARGKPIMGDSDYESLKSEVKGMGPKKMDITAMLLSVKGQEYLTSQQYEELSEKMQQLGINVGIEGATCTISQPPDDVANDPSGVLQMFLAIGFLPTVLLGVLPSTVTGFFTGGSFPSPALGIGWTLASGSALTYAMIRYMGLHNTEILTGQCPCCEAPVKLLFSGDEPPEANTVKCNSCGSTCSINRVTKKIQIA